MVDLASYSTTTTTTTTPTTTSLSSSLLSPGECEWIQFSVQQNLRLDGRTRTQYREMILETGVLPNASGSCRLKLSNTDILVGIKLDVTEPEPNQPNLGYFICSVDCASMASTRSKSNEDLSNELTQLLTRQFAISPNETRPLYSQLCIVEGETCWVVYIDVLVLSMEGNLVDAIFLATKAALMTTLIPKVQLQELSEGRFDYEINDTEKMELKGMNELPLCVTVNQIGNYHVLDATLIEEQVASSKLYVFVSLDNQITHIEKASSGGMDVSVFRDMTQSGKRIAMQLHTQLHQLLVLEKEQVQLAKASGIQYKKWGFFA